MSSSVQRKIVKPLLAWYYANKREMPWRDSNNPYYIWISEIMLQQTQVETVKPYFERFIKNFPTVKALASADEQSVLKQWEGLGYYTRARNLHKAAKIIVTEHKGKIPDSFESLLGLPGLGMYSAAAISSIAFGEKVSAIDGNVLRVFSRLTELSDDISKQKTKEFVFGELNKVILEENAGDFNQAMMELGAVICKAKNPACDICPVRSYCSAYLSNNTALFPVKKKPAVRPHKEIAVGIVFKGGKILIAKRHENQMLGGLWEFPGGKVEQGETHEECVVREFKEEVNLQIEVVKPLCKVDHAFTHFTITITAYICNYVSGNAKAISGSKIKWVYPESLTEFPFPKANKVIIEKTMKFLNGI